MFNEQGSATTHKIGDGRSKTADTLVNAEHVTDLISSQNERDLMFVWKHMVVV